MEQFNKSETTYFYVIGLSYKKADAKSIEENNTLLWAKKIFKTKPNRTLSENLKSEIKTIFHHLTKEELIDKLVANYVANNSATKTIASNSNKKKKK